MTRSMFIRLATRVLARNQGQPPEVLARLIADEIDMVIELMRDLRDAPAEPGEQPTQARSEPSPPLQSPSTYQWPNVNPDALGLERGTETLSDRLGRPERHSAAHPDGYVPADSPAQKLTVDQLHALVSERTPPQLNLEIEDHSGQKFRVTLARNVIAAHAEACVKLCYYYPPRPNDLSVEEVITVDDVPVDLARVTERLKSAAISLLKPLKGPLVVTPPPMPDGPVVDGESDVPGDDLRALTNIWQRSL